MNNLPTIHLADNLRRLPKQKGMRVKDVHNMLTEAGVKVPIKVVYDWQEGNSRPRLEYLVVFARYFGVTVDQLITVEGLRCVPDPSIRIYKADHEQISYYN